MKRGGLHVVCPPIFIATRQRCGGACQEKLGGLWVAFFLTVLCSSSFRCPLDDVEMLKYLSERDMPFALTG